MQRTIVFVVVLAAIVGGLGFVFKGLDTQVKRLKFEGERYELKQKFLGAVPALVHSEEQKAAFDLVQSVRNYAKDLTELYKKYPQFRDPDSVAKRYEAEYKEGKKEEAKMRLIRERIALVKEVWEKLLKDDYKVVASAHGPSVRMDIFDVVKKNMDGQDKLLVYGLWVGAPKDKGLQWGPIQMTVPLEDDEATAKKRAKKELVDQSAIRKAEINGSGPPNTLINDPEHWVEDFPPGLQIGFYDFPLFPGESKALELTMMFDVRTAGGSEVKNEVKFKPLELKPEWKLPAGTSFGAEEE